MSDTTLTPKEQETVTALVYGDAGPIRQSDAVDIIRRLDAALVAARRERDALDADYAQEEHGG